MTLITTDAEPDAVGVPDIDPVDVFRESPSAVNPLEPLCTEYVFVFPPPEAEIDNVYAIPRVPVRPFDGVVIEIADRGVADVDVVAVPAPAEFRALI